MNEMKGMPPVEPLSDLEWKRIEEGLMSHLDRESGPPVAAPVVSDRRPWRTAAAWTAVGAVAAAAIVLVVTRGGDPAAPGHASRMATADASSVMTLRDATLTVAPHSALLVSEDQQGGVLVVLERGSVHCAVAPRAGRPPFVVNAGEVRVEVVGTHFGVSRDGDLARVTVDDGIVVVIHRGVRHEIGPGHRWPDELAAAEPAPPAPEPVSSDPAVPESEVADVIEVEAAPEPAPKKHPRPVVSAKERYGRAAAMEARDPDGALAIYRQIADAGGPWAPLALFAKGRLELDLGRTEAGTRTLRAYLERFPAGPNAADARALLKQR